MELKTKINKKNIIVFFVLFLTFVFFLAGSFNYASAAKETGGLVPCGHYDPELTSEQNFQNRCTLCHLIVGINGIIIWGRTILIVVALTAITAGGVMYIVSAGNEEMMQTAKNIIKQALWGVVIVLGAWVIINTTMWILSVSGGLGVNATSWSDFNCDGVPSDAIGECSKTEKGVCITGTPSGLKEITGGWYWECLGKDEDDLCYYYPSATEPPKCKKEKGECEIGNPQNLVLENGTWKWVCVNSLGTISCTATDTTTEPIGSEEEIRKILDGLGVTIPNSPCAAGKTTGCTNVGGFNEHTIAGIIDLTEACPSCEIVITGGSESHTKGTFSHENGYKVDFRLTDSLTKYITNNYPRTGTRSDGSPLYTDPNGNIYAREGDHWDVCYHCF